VNSQAGSGSEWTEEIRLPTVDANGDTQEVTIRLGAPSVARAALLDQGSTTVVTGTDYLNCLAQLRAHLERQGRLLCCQGARPDVFPSGQLRQFGNGREAYVLRPAGGRAAPEVVDIFAPASPGDVVTLDAQRTAVLAFWRARRAGREA
jgi:hypothetical protein